MQDLWETSCTGNWGYQLLLESCTCYAMPAGKKSIKHCSYNINTEATPRWSYTSCLCVCEGGGR